MRSMQQHGAGKDRSRLVLAVAIALLVLGAVLLAASFVLSAEPAFAGLDTGLRLAVPYILLAGFALLVVYAVVRPKAIADRHAEPTLFGKDTTVFASQMDDKDKGES